MEYYNIRITIFIIIYFSCSSIARNDIYLDSNNKLQNIIVYINDNVGEGDGSLLNNIQELVEHASKSLWIATGNLDENKAAVQMGEVYIRVPWHWKLFSNHRIIGAKSVSCDQAAILISSNRESVSSTKPFTKQLGQCGEAGIFTKYSEKFFNLNMDSETKSIGRQIMREFVKLRYGVFSEEPLDNILTVFDGLNFIDSKCGQDVKWKSNRPIENCTTKNNDCSYEILENQLHNYSVMFDYTSSKSALFCDNNQRPHNKFAHNLQNIKCNGQSISQVILKHRDFNENKTSLPFQMVDFQIIRGERDRVVLLVDTSASMKSVMADVKKALIHFIKSYAKTELLIGLASFSSKATEHSFVNLLNSPDHKNKMIEMINDLSVTNDGALFYNLSGGIYTSAKAMGYDLLKSPITKPGLILIITTGQNKTHSPDFINCKNQLKASKMRIDSVIFDEKFDSTLYELSRSTQGKYYNIHPDQPYYDLSNRLQIIRPCDGLANKISTVFGDSRNILINANVVNIKLGSLDKYQGKNATISISLDNSKTPIKAQIIDSDDRIFDMSNKVQQNKYTTYLFQLPNNRKVGPYILRLYFARNRRLYKRNLDKLQISFIVSATQDSSQLRVINPSGQLSTSEVEVLQSTTSVTANVDMTPCGIKPNENVSVILHLTNPNKVILKFNMSDDGLGDDSIEGDKIFTRKILAKHLSIIGLYNIYASVEIISPEENNSPIKRSVELGGIRVKALSKVAITDKVPPATIEQIHVNVDNSAKKIISIEFQSTGNDGVVGNITIYEIKIKCENSTVIKLIKRNSIPKTKIKVFVDLSKDNITNPFKVSVRGVDEKENYGQWSMSKISNWEYEKIKKKFSIYFEDKVCFNYTYMFPKCFEEKKEAPVILKQEKVKCG